MFSFLWWAHIPRSSQASHWGARAVHTSRPNCTMRWQKSDCFSGGRIPARVFTTQFTNPVTGDIVESRDNYSGLRYYPKMDAYGNPIYKNGQPELDRWWSGDAHSNNPSGFALLLDKAQTFVKAHNQNVNPDEKLPSITSYRAFFQFLNSNPKCLIKTEYPSFGNQTFTKEVIQEFIE